MAHFRHHLLLESDGEGVMMEGGHGPFCVRAAGEILFILQHQGMQIPPHHPEGHGGHGQDPCVPWGCPSAQSIGTEPAVPRPDPC